MPDFRNYMPKINLQFAKIDDYYISVFASPIVHSPEYWLFCTKRCNLDCIYCFEEDRKGDPEYELEELINFFVILDNTYFLKTGGNPKPRLMFYGGEPTLAQPFIKKVIAGVKEAGLDMGYGLQTNGTLLRELDKDIMKELDVMSISLDGPEEITDKYRGKGTYKKAVDGMKYIKEECRESFRGRLLQRTTLPIQEEVFLFESVKTANELGFDDMMFQIETPIVRNVSNREIAGFVKSYGFDIQRAFDYYIDRWKNGKKGTNIIPLQTAMRLILAKTYDIEVPPKVPMCGCGDNLMAIETDGIIYGCDTLIGKQEGVIGSIQTGVQPKVILEGVKLGEYSRGCARRSTESQLSFGKFEGEDGGKNYDLYCSCAATLMLNAGNALGEVQKLFNDGKISLEDFLHSPAAEFTEQLP